MPDATTDHHPTTPALDLDTTSLLYRLQFTDSDRPIDKLVRRLRQADGADWCRRTVANLVPPDQEPYEQFAQPCLGLDQLRQMKQAFRAAAKSTADGDARLAAILGDILTVAAASRHYSVLLSGRGPVEVAEGMAEIASVLPKPWAGFLWQAAPTPAPAAPLHSEAATLSPAPPQPKRLPKRESGSAANHFPDGATEHVRNLVDQGTAARPVINRYIMEVYREPLRHFLSGIWCRRLGESDELINGFFAEALSRPDFFKKWVASDRRLRQWFITAFWFYLKKLWKKRKQDNERGLALDAIPEPPARPAPPGKDVWRAVARAWARAGLDLAASQAAAKDLLLNWEMFVGFYLRGFACVRLAAEAGVTPNQAWGKIKIAKQWCIESLREVLRQQGVPEDQIDDELLALLRDAGLSVRAESRRRILRRHRPSRATA